MVRHPIPRGFAHIQRKEDVETEPVTYFDLKNQPSSSKSLGNINAPQINIITSSQVKQLNHHPIPIIRNHPIQQQQRCESIRPASTELEDWDQLLPISTPRLPEPPTPSVFNQQEQSHTSLTAGDCSKVVTDFVDLTEVTGPRKRRTRRGCRAGRKVQEKRRKAKIRELLKLETEEILEKLNIAQFYIQSDQE
ncbi:hypothetical protein DMENIID0001_111750 [Sergentomyia squamirostris]